MFNKLNARKSGAKGGKAKTKLKGKTARTNGSLGGRPPTKTLAERLLNRTIYPGQQKYIEQAMSDMIANERQQLEEYFHLKGGVLSEYFMHGEEMFRTLDSKAWKTKSRRVPKEIRYLIKKFRLAANHYLRDVPMPTPYSVEYQRRLTGNESEWDRRHAESRIPYPPIKVSVDIRRLPDFRLIELKHKKGVIWTVKELMEISSQWTKKRAEVAIKWLNAMSPQSPPEKKDSDVKKDRDEERYTDIPF